MNIEFVNGMKGECCGVVNCEIVWWCRLVLVILLELGVCKGDGVLWKGKN